MNNLKNILEYWAQKNETDLNDDLRKKFFSRTLWCASSTHSGEEIFCVHVHKKLKSKHKNLLTIIIPRHAERANEIKNEIEELNLKVHIHSSKNKMPKDTEIYLVDSYGKTKSFFKLCKIVFLGGSLIKHGGQNPLEAAKYGCKILHGPNIWNFKEIYDLLKEFKITGKIKDTNQMKRIIQDLLNKKNNSTQIKTKFYILSVVTIYFTIHYK
jgi:3-deoxy-D-manno-octulosonic-acid transferase